MTRVLMTADQLQRPVPGGIGTYIKGLSTALVPEHEVTWWGGRQQLPFVDFDIRPRHSGLPLKALVKAWDVGLAGPLRAFDVVHASSLAVPPRRHLPTSVMVHDVGWRHFPDAYPKRGREWHEAALQRAVKRADILFTPSSATADELRAMGVADDRVVEVIEGADHLPAADHEAADEFLQAAGVSGPFILAVGTLEPRKNLARLFTAYAATGLDLPLVVVGPVGWGDEVLVPEQVVAGGPAEPEVISALYAKCHVFASVPLLEGWGLPVAEAMHAGAPVVCSPVPSAGDGALIVDPLDTDAIAGALLEVATDEDRRRSLVSAGRERAASLTWKRSAEQHVEAWRAIT